MATSVLTASLDTYMDAAFPDTNYGTNVQCLVNAVSGSNRRRGLVCFDTSSIPAVSTITGATLTIECTTAAAGAGTAICELLIIDNLIAEIALIEAETTWNNRTTAQVWGTGGGDIETAYAGTSFATPTSTGVMPTIDVTTMLNGARDSYGYPQQVGFVIRQSVTLRNWAFASKESSGKTVPTLTVTHTGSSTRYPVVGSLKKPRIRRY